MRSILSKHSWPGNVRELANLMERLVVVTPESVIGVTQLPDGSRQGNQEKQQGQVDQIRHLKTTVAEFELDLIAKVLETGTRTERRPHPCWESVFPRLRGKCGRCEGVRI